MSSRNYDKSYDKKTSSIKNRMRRVFYLCEKFQRSIYRIENDIHKMKSLFNIILPYIECDMTNKEKKEISSILKGVTKIEKLNEKRLEIDKEFLELKKVVEYSRS